MKNIILIFAFLVLGLTGCKKEISNYTLGRSDMTLKIGESHTFVMSLDGEEFNPNLFDWTSSNTNVAGVNAGGYVKATQTGKATITASFKKKSTDKEYSATCEVTVTP